MIREIKKRDSSQGAMNLIRRIEQGLIMDLYEIEKFIGHKFKALRRVFQYHPKLNLWRLCLRRCDLVFRIIFHEKTYLSCKPAIRRIIYAK